MKLQMTYFTVYFYIEWWNTNFWLHFHVYVFDEGAEKICKKFNFQDDSFWTDQYREKIMSKLLQHAEFAFISWRQLKKVIVKIYFINFFQFEL